MVRVIRTGLLLLVCSWTANGCDSNDTSGSEADNGTPGDAAPELSVTSQCPEVAPTTGQDCQVDETVQCMGAEYSGTCLGESSGNEVCYCESGKWSCFNWSCPSWCPSTYAEAQAGPACAPQGDGTGACYYGPDGFCTCQGGKIVCSNYVVTDGGTVPSDGGTAPTDGGTATCPSEFVQEGDLCTVPFSLTCTGSSYSGTCSGESSGHEMCYCESGKWSCFNWSCPSWCPKTFLEAKAGPSCSVPLLERGGACYYKDGGPCSCDENGKVSCPL